MNDIIDQWGLLDPARAAHEVNTSGGGSSGPTIIEITTGASPLVIEPDPAIPFTLYHITTGGTAGDEVIHLGMYARTDPGDSSLVAANGNRVTFIVAAQTDEADAVHVHVNGADGNPDYIRSYSTGGVQIGFIGNVGGESSFVLLDFQGATTSFEWTDSSWNWDGRGNDWDNYLNYGVSAPGNISSGFKQDNTSTLITASAGAVIQIAGAASTADDAGAGISIHAGDSTFADQSAGAVNISAGATSADANNAPALSLQAGFAEGAGSAGGDLNLLAGGSGSGASGGNVQIQAGQGDGGGNHGGNLHLFAGSAANGADQGEALVSGGAVTLQANTGNVTIGAVVGLIVIGDLPTSDPIVTGALWNSSGTLKISAG